MKNLDEVGGWIKGYQDGYDDAMKMMREFCEKLAKDTGEYFKDRMVEMGIEQK